MHLYSLEEAAECLGIKPISLKVYARIGRVQAKKRSGEYFFEEEALQLYLKERKNISLSRAAIKRNFDAKYGEGVYQRLIELFAKPCVSYQEIADEYGVTKECVSQWHGKILPEAVKGLERRHTCTVSARRQKLFGDELFRKFYQIARHYFPPESIEPIPILPFLYVGFRKRAVKLNGKKVLLRKGQKTVYNKPHLHISNPREKADYVFYIFGNNHFLFLPKDSAPRITTRFPDSETSKYHKFKNNFDALLKNIE